MTWDKTTTACQCLSPCPALFRCCCVTWGHLQPDALLSLWLTVGCMHSKLDHYLTYMFLRQSKWNGSKWLKLAFFCLRMEIPSFRKYFVHILTFVKNNPIMDSDLPIEGAAILIWQLEQGLNLYVRVFTYLWKSVVELSLISVRKGFYWSISFSVVCLDDFWTPVNLNIHNILRQGTL